MISIEKIGVQALAIDLSGEVTSQDVKAVDSAIRDAFDESGDIHVLLDLTGISDVTAGAVATDLKVETALLPHLGRFGRMATITDKAWISTVMRAAAHLMPGLDFQSFSPEEALSARAFVLGAQEKETKPAIRPLESPHPHVLAYEIDGFISQADADDLFAKFNDLMEISETQGAKVGLLVRIKSFNGFAPTMLVSGSVWSTKLNAIRNLHRYAIIGAQGWMTGLTQLVDPITAVEIKNFTAEEEDAAREWVSEGL